MTRGGARANSGPKPNPEKRKIHKHFRISPVVYQYLSGTPNATATMEQAVINSKEYKQWIKRTKQPTNP